MHQNKRIIMWLNHEYGEGNDNVKIVIEALEKQIPKKVKNVIKRPNGKYGYCPVCNHALLKENYCHRCGNALDWGEENG